MKRRGRESKDTTGDSSKDRSKNPKLSNTPVPSNQPGALTASNSGKRLTFDFYNVPCEQLAVSLLGKVLVRHLDDGTEVRGRIVETEAYLGGDDKGSCTYGGKQTERTRALYMDPGTLYVYLTYGMYHCINISSQGDGAAVLLRSLEPLDGLPTMEKRRLARKSKARSIPPHELCNGPSKLCISFEITRAMDKQDLCTMDQMWIVDDGYDVSNSDIVKSSRVGIDSAGVEWASKLLRYYVSSSTSVSVRDKKREKNT